MYPIYFLSVFHQNDMKTVVMCILYHKIRWYLITCSSSEIIRELKKFSQDKRVFIFLPRLKKTKP